MSSATLVLAGSLGAVGFAFCKDDYRDHPGDDRRREKDKDACSKAPDKDEYDPAPGERRPAQGAD